MLGSPGQGHLARPMGPQQGVALACQMPKWGAKLALAVGNKQQRETFASNCWAAPQRAPHEKNASLGP